MTSTLAPLALSPSRPLARVLAALTLVSAASAQVVFVDKSATGANDGTTWADAFKSLDDGIDDALSSAGEAVLVAHGTYYPSVKRDATDDRSAAFELKPNVRVIGGYLGGGSIDPNDPDGSPRLTVLSGNIGNDALTDNCYNVVYAPGTATEEVQDLERVTVRDGYADGPDQGDPDFDYQLNGAGVYASRLPGSGGGRLRLTQNLILDNYAEYNGGGVFFAGSSSTDSFMGAYQCFVTDNEAGRRGGGFNVQRTGALPDDEDEFDGEEELNGSYIMNCSILDNEAGFDYEFLDFAGGGAVWLEDLTQFFTFQLSNNRVAGNVVKGRAAAYAITGVTGRVSIANDTIHDNTVDESESGEESVVFFEDAATPWQFFRNNIVWGNRGRSDTSDPLGIIDIYESGGAGNAATITHCDIELASGVYNSVVSNINQDPVFANAMSRDFSLLSTSPCIDAGLNSAINRDLPDMDNDNTRNEALPRDYRASALVGRTIGLSVDMGAYEQ